MKQHYFSLKLLAVLLLFCQTIIAQNPQWSWSRSFGNTGNESVQKIATDSRNGVYGYGSFNGATLQIGTSTFSNAGGSDLFLVKYDTVGNVQWAKAFGGSGIDSVGGLSTDGSGKIIVSGSFQNSITLGSTTLMSTGGSDVFVAQLDNNGNYIWAKQFSGVGNDIASAVKCDVDGNIYLTGKYAGGNLSIGGITLFNTDAFNVFYCKLNSSGSTIWAKNKSNATVNFNFYDIELFGTSRLILAGSGTSTTGGSLNFSPIEGGTPVDFTNGGNKIFTIKTDTAGLCYFQTAGPGFSFLTIGNGTAITNDKKILTAGNYIPLSSGIPRSFLNRGDSNNVTINYNGSYALSATDLPYVYMTDVVATRQNRIFTVGNNFGTIVFDGGFSIPASSGTASLFVWETDTALVTKNLLAVTPTGTFAGSLFSLAVDTMTNSLYAAGQFTGNPLILGYDTLTSQGQNDALITKISINGYNPNQPLSMHSNDVSVCAGSTATIGNPAGATGGQAPYTYSWSPAAGLSDPTAPVTSFIATTSQAYILTVSDAASHVFADTVQVTVVAAPSTPVITASGPTTFCAGGSVTLTASAIGAGHAYVWNTGASTASITVLTGGTYSVKDSIISTGCVSAQGTITTVVNPIPATPVITSGPLSFCAGSSVTLNSSPAANYLWSNGATTQSITVTVSDTYTVQASAAGCLSTVSSQVVTHAVPVPATPVITASGTTTFCAGGNVTLTSSAGTQYLWSNGASTQAITTSIAGTFAVRDSVPGCASALSVPVVTVVTALPAIPTITASGPLTFCSGGNVVLTSSTGHNYLWSTGATTQAITVTTGGSYSVKDTDLGCSSVFSTASVVTINALPPVPTITQSGATLTSSADAGNQWYKDGQPIDGATGKTYTYSTSATYSVKVTNAEGCSIFSGDITARPLNGNVFVLRNGDEFLHQVSPNPVTNNSFITYNLKSASTVSIFIVNANGQRSIQLKQSQQQAAGYYSIPVRNVFNGLKNGIYIVEYIVNGERITDKVFIAK